MSRERKPLISEGLITGQIKRIKGMPMRSGSMINLSLLISVSISRCCNAPRRMDAHFGKFSTHRCQSRVSGCVMTSNSYYVTAYLNSVLLVIVLDSFLVYVLFAFAALD